MKNKLLTFLIMILCLQSAGQSVPNTTTFTLQDVVNVTGGTSLTAAFANATGTFDPAYVGSKNSLLNFRNYQSVVVSCQNPALTLKILWAYTNCAGSQIFFYSSYNGAVQGLSSISSGSCSGGGFFAKGLTWAVGDVIYGMLSCGICDCPGNGYFLLSTPTPTISDPVYHIINGILIEIIYP